MVNSAICTVIGRTTNENRPKHTKLSDGDHLAYKIAGSHRMTAKFERYQSLEFFTLYRLVKFDFSGFTFLGRNFVRKSKVS